MLPSDNISVIKLFKQTQTASLYFSFQFYFTPLNPYTLLGFNIWDTMLHRGANERSLTQTSVVYEIALGVSCFFLAAAKLQIHHMEAFMQSNFRVYLSCIYRLARL